MKNKKTKRLLSFIISITLIFSLCFNILFGVSAENTVSNAIFSYGDFDGVETAIGDNPDNILISGDKITLPENNNALNLYWENGEKLYKAGTEVSVSDLVKDGDGDYKFVAKFGSFTMDYDDIDTEPFTFYTQDGPQVDTFFGQFHKNKWWGIPTGYANDGTSNTAFGANNFTVKKRTGDGESGNYLFMKKWAASGTYFNAAFFSHSPFDTTDVNSHNSNATGTINYKYAYFTPGEEYTITFDYMLDTTDGGEPPYSASIAFGMDTKTGQNNCAQKTIEYADGKVARTNVNLGTENGKWKTTSVTVKAPEDYTGNDITSARMGISLKVKTGNGCYIDNVRVQLNGSKVYFKYGESSETSSVFGEDLVAYTDEEGNITLPNNESAINLLWKHGDNLYEPGTNLNVNGLGKEVTFTAYFGGATLNFEDICTNSIQMVDKSSSNKQNLYRELNRNPGYWKVPQGLSNTSVKTNYGTALGHHSMGIISSVGKTGKGLQLEIRKNYTPEYREAVLFNHSPTTFTETSNITYGYVYYNTNTEYTMEFDYKTTASVDVTVAFGVDTNWTNTSSGVAIKSVNSNDFTKKDSYITLESTNGEWAHASITIKSPSSYVGNGVTSARVGIAVKDNEATASDAEKRYDYFDNIVFYPTSMDYETVKIIYGAETSDEDCQTISYFKPKAPLKSNTSILLPENGTINACVRTGTNNNGSWKAPYGKISNLIGWEIQGSDKVYSPQDNVNVSDLPKNAVISAIYGDEMVDFENLDDSFKIFNSNSTSYGSKSATIISENENKFVRLEGQPESTDKTYSHILAFTESGKFAAYNINTTYKITFKMRRLDNVDKESKVYFAFGATPFDWRANNTRVAYSEICVAKKGMSDFDTYTVVVTSPNNYASVKGSEKFYSRAMAIGAELSEGVIIDFDDIKIEAIGLDGDDFGIATFDFGMSEKFGDTKTFKFANSVFLPGKQVVNAAKRSGTNQENVDWQTNHGKVSNHTAWYCNNNKKYYQLGEKVSADEVGKNPTFTAVYEGGSVDFNNLSNDFEFRKDNDTSYSASFAKIEGSTNKYVNLTGNEIQDNTSTQVLLFNETNEFLSYNLNKKYKVSFKYRRTDSENVNSQLYFAFGAIPWGWRAASGCVNKIVIGEAKKGMTEFETVTIYVTAPNTYEYSTGGSNPEYFHSRTMAIGATLSNGVSIDFDDIIVEPVDFEGKDIGVATFDFGMSDKFNDTKTIEFTDTLHLPIQQSPKAGKRSGTNEKGQYWQTVHGQVSNHTAWYCNNNKKYYQLGEEVSVDEVGKNPTFTAVYEGGSVDFNNLSNDFKFRKDNDTSYSASLAKVKGSTNKYVNLTGGEEHKNTSVQVLLFNDTNRFLSYNTSETYKVTFKYRRTDSKNVNSQLYFAFGAIPWGWRAASGCVNKIVIGEAKKGMTEFETVTIYVTAPNTYEYSTGGSNPEYFHSRTMAIGATLSNGVSIDFDDIIVEPIAHDEIAMTFTVPEKKTQKVIIGKAGTKLTIPNVELDRNSVIDGWFFDEGFTKEFTLKTFPTNDMIVYGKVGPATVRYYGFTDYPWDTSIREGSYARKEHHIIEDGFSSDGDGYALKIDNTIDGANEEQQGVALPLKIKPNTKYLISFDFYYENVGDRASSFSEFWFNTSVSGLLWKGIQQNITNEDEYTPANIKEKKWYTGYVYGTTTEFTWSNGLSLFFRVPVGSVCFVDNIIVTEIPEEQSIALLKVGSFQSPEPIVASKNSTIKLPKVKLEGNYAFLNWILKNEEYTADTYVLSEDTIFTAKTTASRFTEGFENTYYGKRGITSFGMDLDWEIYDSQSGNNSNVKGGRYSLHRIGKDIRNTAYCFHHNSDVTEYTMAEGQIYTVSFWVKVENPVHKLGSIDIASCISLGNPWDFPADRLNVTAISDIADGEWHKVSYTMMASGPYLSIVVPGNLSIYIDDLTVEYTPTATKSENCSFEEYIPAYLTADGKYIKPDLDADELGKFELVKRTDETSAGNDGTSLLIIVICAVAVIVLMGGTAVTILLIRKKKNIGGKKS